MICFVCFVREYLASAFTFQAVFDGGEDGGGRDVKQDYSEITDRSSFLFLVKSSWMYRIVSALPVSYHRPFVLAFPIFAISQRIQSGVAQLGRVVIHRLYRKKKSLRKWHATSNAIFYLVNESVLLSSLYTAGPILSQTMDGSGNIDASASIQMPHANIDGQDGARPSRSRATMDDHGCFVFLGLTFAGFHQESNDRLAVLWNTSGRPRAANTNC